MNKYNKIMSRVTVDPEMKSRVMSAVSAAIREQSGGAVVTDLTDIEDERPVRKKARKTPIAVISSIAAALVLIIGVLFVFRNMDKHSASETMSTTMAFDAADNHNKGVQDASGEVNFVISNEATLGTEANYEDENVYETTVDVDDKRNYSSSNNKTIDGITNDQSLYITNPNATTGGEGSEGIGDARLDRINKALPFDLKGFGSGTYSEDITYELFLGEGGEKIILFEASEGTDILKKIEPSNKSSMTDSVTPSGIPVKLCLVTFANVTASENSSDVNAALYSKGGMTYLIVFSDVRPADVIAAAVDAM